MANTDLNMIVELNRLKTEIPNEAFESFDRIRNTLKPMDVVVLDGLREALIEHNQLDPSATVFRVLTITPSDEFPFPHIVMADGPDRFCASSRSVHWFDRNDPDEDCVIIEADDPGMKGLMIQRSDQHLLEGIGNAFDSGDRNAPININDLRARGARARRNRGLDN